jgi:transposase
MTTKEVSEVLFPTGETQPIFKMPDYEYVHREMQKSGATLNLLWLEYCDQCREAGEMPYKSTQFNKYYSDFLLKTKATMHLSHKPGEVMQVDWCGQTAFLIDTDTGELIKAYVFVAVLPYSSCAYVEAFLNRDQESWICAHTNAYRYFGGATRILTPDNLKTGVTKNSKDETVINRIYQEMAEHYGTAVLPARPFSPKDKGAVENTVGIVSTFILAALRNQQFFTLPELNQAIWGKLDEFNLKPFQKKTGSRASALEEEKPFLLPLPTHPFEMASWKVATVQFNYHISVESQNYSCPYEYIKQKVNVRLTKNAVEIFYDSNRIASHFRLYGRPNQYSTNEGHMPPDHQQYIQWNRKRFLSWAEKIGPHTMTVIQWFLQQYSVEQQGYKACMALLKLSDKHTPGRVEAACKRVLSFTPQPSLKSIQSVLRSGQDKLLQDDGSAPSLPDASAFGFTRGADYYGSGR